MKSRFQIGTVIEKVTKAVGLKPCGSCSERKELLNNGEYGKALLTFVGVRREDVTDIPGSAE